MDVRAWWSGFEQGFADFLGRRCVVCAQNGDWLCGQCEHDLVAFGVHCVCCTRKMGHAGLKCGRCLRVPHALDELFVGYHYGFVVRECLLKAKYGRDRGALLVLERLAGQVAQMADLAVEMVVPMPIAKRRLAVRGFNQSRFLARAVVKVTGAAMVDGVLVKSARVAQSSLHSDALRFANIRGAFAIKQKVSGHVLLVDDVITSGSTAQEAARMLKMAGAEKVSLLTVAGR